MDTAGESSKDNIDARLNLKRKHTEPLLSLNDTDSSVPVASGERSTPQQNDDNKLTESDSVGSDITSDVATIPTLLPEAIGTTDDGIPPGEIVDALGLEYDNGCIEFGTGSREDTGDANKRLIPSPCGTEAIASIKTVQDEIECGWRLEHHVAMIAANAPSEDRFLVCHSRALDATVYAVLDGHGGDQVAEYLQEWIAPHLFDAMEKKKRNQYVTGADSNASGGGGDSGLQLEHEQVRAVLSDTFVSLDKSVLVHVQVRAAQREKEGVAKAAVAKGTAVTLTAAPVTAVPSTTTGTSSSLRRSARAAAAVLPSRVDFASGKHAGSCAIVVLVFQGHVYCANVGDCRVVLGSSGKDNKVPVARMLVGPNASGDSNNNTQNDIATSVPFTCGVGDEPQYQPHQPSKKRRRLAGPPLVVSTDMSGMGARPDILNTTSTTIANDTPEEEDLDVDTSGTAANSSTTGTQELDANTPLSNAAAGTPSPSLYHQVLSRDHTCDDPVEMRSVKRRSGDPNAIRLSRADMTMSNMDGPKRVAGSLIVTRAFGDLYLKGSDCLGDSLVPATTDTPHGASVNSSGSSSSSCSGINSSSTSNLAVTDGQNDANVVRKRPTYITVEPDVVMRPLASSHQTKQDGQRLTNIINNNNNNNNDDDTVATQEFLVIASDGLWNHMSNVEAVEEVDRLMREQQQQQEQDQQSSLTVSPARAHVLAEGLVNLALVRAAQSKGMPLGKLLALPLGRRRRMVHDDVTCIVVCLHSVDMATPRVPRGSLS